MTVEQVVSETGLDRETASAALAAVAARCHEPDHVHVSVDHADCGCCYAVYVTGPAGRSLVGGTW